MDNSRASGMKKGGTSDEWLDLSCRMRWAGSTRLASKSTTGISLLELQGIEVINEDEVARIIS